MAQRGRVFSAEQTFTVLSLANPIRFTLKKVGAIIEVNLQQGATKMSQNYWLHRISYLWEITYPLFDKGYLSHGWSYLMNTDILDQIRSGGKTAFNQFMNERNETSRSRWNLWNFSQFEVGDKIVVPFDREFAVCEVTRRATPVTILQGEQLLSRRGESLVITDKGIFGALDSQPYDVGFVVGIRELIRLPRDYADAALIARMKIRQANADINDLSDSVEAAMKATAPVSIHDTVLDSVAENIQKIMEKHITPDKLEHVIKWYMKQMGADRVRIPAKNEPNKANGADADIIAEFDDLGLVFCIQAKKHRGTTNEWSVTQISEYVKQKHDEDSDYTYIPWVVSTAEFTEAAIEQAKDEKVRLIGGNDFIKMLLNCGIKDIDQAVIG